MLAFPDKPTNVDIQAALSELSKKFLPSSSSTSKAGEWVMTAIQQYRNSMSLFRPDGFTDREFTNKWVCPLVRAALARTSNVADMADWKLPTVAAVHSDFMPGRHSITRLRKSETKNWSRDTVDQQLWRCLRDCPLGMLPSRAGKDRLNLVPNDNKSPSESPTSTSTAPREARYSENHFVCPCVSTTSNNRSLQAKEN